MSVDIRKTSHTSVSCPLIRMDLCPLRDRSSVATSHLSTISVYPSADVCEVLASPNSQISWVGGLSLWFCSVFINVETDHMVCILMGPGEYLGAYLAPSLYAQSLGHFILYSMCMIHVSLCAGSSDLVVSCSLHMSSRHTFISIYKSYT